MEKCLWSVYRDQPREPATEESAVLDCAPDASGTIETLGYGELKAGCERAVQEAMPGRSLIARPCAGWGSLLYGQPLTAG